MMRDRFQNKVALVTGSSRGVGYAIAKQLLEQGAKVVITARSAERLEESRKKLNEWGEVYAIPGDVKKWEDAKHLIEACTTHFGRLDILVNNAGLSMRGLFNDLDVSVIDDVIQTNLMGSIYLSRLAMPHIKKNQGNVIFISSIAGLLGLPNASIYCAAKGALKNFSNSLRIEMEPFGVHIGIVYLGFTENDPEKRVIAADGSLEVSGRPAHHTQAQAAELIVGMIAKRKRHIAMTSVGKLAYLISRFFPYAVERLITFARVRNWKIYKSFS